MLSDVIGSRGNRAEKTGMGKVTSSVNSRDRRVMNAIIHERRALIAFFFSSRRRHTRFDCDWSSDVCSSDLMGHERFAPLKNVLEKRPERVIEKAVWGMLPKTTLSRQKVKQMLKVYAGPEIGRASCRERV